MRACVSACVLTVEMMGADGACKARKQNKKKIPRGSSTVPRYGVGKVPGGGGEGRLSVLASASGPRTTTGMCRRTARCSGKFHREKPQRSRRRKKKRREDRSYLITAQSLLQRNGIIQSWIMVDGVAWAMGGWGGGGVSGRAHARACACVTSDKSQTGMA